MEAEEEEIEFLEHDLKRSMVNNEFMILHGNDPSGYLPPLPKQQRPHFRTVGAWLCSDPAMRQVSDVSRRGPRSPLPGCKSSTSLSDMELVRPQTSYTAHVQGILTRRFSQDIRRPHTSYGKLEGCQFLKVAPEEDLQNLIVPKPLKVYPDLLSVGSIVDTIRLSSAAGLRRPRFRSAPKKNRKKRDEKRSKRKIATADARRVEQCNNVLTGEWTNLPAEVPTSVRFYLCALEDDQELERQALFNNAFPQLQEFCQQNDLDFEVVDLRWRSGKHITSFLQVTESYKQGIDHCKNVSMGPYFVLLLGDQYGKGYMPFKIDEKEFGILKSVAEQSEIKDRDIYVDWYILDQNAQPAVYVLQGKPKSQRRNGVTDAVENQDIPDNQYERIMEVLVEPCQRAINMRKLEPSSKEKYTKSVFEDEIVKGLLEDPDTRSHCLVYIRELVDIPQKTTSNLTYMQKVDGSLISNEAANPLLEQLKTDVIEACNGTNIRSYKIKANNYFTHSHLHKTEADDQDTNSRQYSEDLDLTYIDEFTQDFVKDFKSKTDKNKEQWEANMGMKHSKIFSEVLHHATRCQHIAQSFVGREGLLSTIKEKLLDQTQRAPLVLSGEPGSGKTCLMSAIACGCKRWLGKSCVVTARFIGTTRDSLDLRSLLVQLVLHLCAVYNLEPPNQTTMESSNRISKVFSTTLEQISKWHGEKKPLVICLDGVDLIEDSDRAHTMFWLPNACPKNVTIILTTDSMKHGILKRLKERFSFSDENFFDVTNLDPDSLEKMMQRQLEMSHRSLQPEQRELVLGASLQNPNALYVTNLLTEVENWKSYTVIRKDMLPTSIEETVWYHLQKLEAKHGSILVQHTLSYLVVSPRGLSENELTDALSCDNSAMEQILSKSEPLTKNTIRMPSSFITRLLWDLKNFLTLCHIDGKQVYCWKHTVLRETVCKKYLDTENPLSWTYMDKVAPFLKILAKIMTQERGVKENFRYPGSNQVIENADRRVAPQPLKPSNRRKLLLSTRYLVYSMDNENDVEELKRKCFCSFQWLLTSLQGLSAQKTLSDMLIVKNRDPDFCLTQDFLSLTIDGLKRDPLGLASQLLGTVSNTSPLKYPFFSGLLREATHWLEMNTSPIIIPSLPCFPSAMDPCKKRMWGLTDIIQVDKSEQLGVMKNKDGFIEIWDLVKNELAFPLGIQYDKVTTNVFTSNVEVLTVDGFLLTVWEIDSGRSIRTVDLSRYIGTKSTSYSVIAHTTDFKLISVLSSDEEFNQTIRIVDTEADSIVQALPLFDVKDEIFGAGSSVLLRNRPHFVFASVRSETMPNDTQADIVKLNCFDIGTGEYVYRTNCGKNMFSSLLIKDEQKAYISWKTGGFDIFDVSTGVFIQRLKPPKNNQVICEAKCVKDNHIAFLTTTNEKKVQQNFQSALWLWELSQKKCICLVHHDYSNAEESLKNFLLSEDLTFAILSAPNVSKLLVWNLVSKLCVQTIEAHSDNIDSLFQTNDPYKFCSSSSGEVVVKWWDVYDLMSHGPHDENKTGENKNDLVTLAVSSSRKKLRRSMSAPSMLRKGIHRLKLDRPVSLKKVRHEHWDDDAGTPTEKTDVDLDLFNDEVSHRNSYFEGKKVDPRSDPRYDRPNMDVALDFSLNTTSLCYSKDGKFILTGSEEMPPVVWEASTAKVVRKMPPHSGDHVGTPIVQYACHDQVIVGLSTNDFTKNSYPYIYMFQIWDAEFGMPKVFKKECLGTAFALAHETEQCLVTSIENFNSSRKEMSNLTFKMLNLKDTTVLYELSCTTACIPTEVQITADMKTCVTNNVQRPEQGSLGLFSFTLDGSEENPVPRSYEYKKGTKYSSYRPTANMLLKNGLSISVGLNGDLQMWDVENNEYEGNLYEDPNISDCMNPGLHNHSGRRIIHAVISEDERYLVCGSQDHTSSLWDLQTEVQLAIYKWHQDEVCRVAISSDNQLVATASKDLELAIWNFGITNRPVCHLFIHVVPTELKIGSDSQTVAAIGARKNEIPRLLLFKLKNV